MAVTQASCPSCGTSLTVTHESTVSLVCKRCHAVLEYRAGTLRQVGNASVVVPTRSSIQTGEEGAYNGTNFQITGHVQLSNEDGATWDEFYLGFSDGLCGWLAQAQGRLILSFRAPLPEGAGIPDFEELKLNSKLPLMKGLPGVSVVEKGEARVEAASGQMPYLLRAGESYPYADFAAMNGAFASLDYSTDPPDLFVGREVTFDDLQMQARRTEPTAQAGSQAPMVCTECGAALAVHSSRSERVTCLQCRAVFDITSGRPAHVGSQEEAPIRPVAPIGTRARFGPQEYTLAGFIQKATSDEEGSTYFWQEYLLTDDEGSHRWLVQDSDGHWSLFEPITGGSDIQPVIAYNGRNYKFYQHGEARVTYLEGEFYWNAAVNQTSYTADFVAPPHMLSAEFSSSDNTKGETSWTHGVYVPVAEVRQSLGTSDVPRARGVGPSQPFAHAKIFPIFWLSILATIVIGILLSNSIQSEQVFKKKFEVKIADAGDDKKGQEIEDRVTLKGGKNIRIRANAESLKSTWLDITGLLAPVEDKDENAPVVQPFQIPIEYYSGFEDGENWTEGSKDNSAYLSALPGGEYILRLNVYCDKNVQAARNGGENIGGPRMDPAQVRDFELMIEQGYPRWWHILWACVFLSIIPLIVWIMSKSFESRRWRNSNVNPGGA